MFWIILILIVVIYIVKINKRSKKEGVDYKAIIDTNMKEYFNSLEFSEGGIDKYSHIIAGFGTVENWNYIDKTTQMYFRETQDEIRQVLLHPYSYSRKKIGNIRGKEISCYRIAEKYNIGDVNIWNRLDEQIRKLLL